MQRRESTLPNKMRLVKTKDSDSRNVDMFRKSVNTFHKERIARKKARNANKAK